MENSDYYLSSKQIEGRIGEMVKISGIVFAVRNQGGLIFIDIKDRNNLIQALAIPDNASVYAISKNVRKGYLVEMKGVVKECPVSVQQENSDSKRIEIEVERISIISARDEEENKSRRILDRSKHAVLKNKKKMI